ncbi:sorting nexin-14 [Elysia marginata]|uniref:Sorting nexin-14 n=1 Tax=Elysia marginata TaxID=1093978 RepID=A0AAV4FEN2_9GAST|nr:sorting nexin-14 [Elysia marginata]
MIPWYLLKIYARTHFKFTAICIGLLFVNVLFLSRTHLLLVVWFFLAGMAIAYSFISPTTRVPNLLPMYTRKPKSTTAEEEELSLMKTLCTVCGQRKCPRHRPELNILAFQPWTNLDIRQSVDTALDEFFSIVIKDYVYTWYRELSQDEGFVDELRTNFRFLASVMLRRIKKVDFPKLVTEKIVKAVIQHIDICHQAYFREGGRGDLQVVVLDCLGARGVHCAMWNRKSELEYLRRLVEALFPYILRPQALNSSACFTEADDFDPDTFVPVLKSTCALVRELLAGSVLLPLMDSLANPDLLNNILLVFFDNIPPPVATEPPTPMVPFLGRFSQPRTHSQSCLRLELKDVINPETPDLLYPFMQFLKSEAAVNVLQFCLACDDFNRRILSPDVSQSEFGELHATAKDLYRSYCAPFALDRIKFDDDVVDTLREIVEGPADQVIRLRTSTPLFKAYEHAYDLLENNFLPMFHQSDDYYNMVCGGRPSSLSRQMSRIPKKRDFTLAQFGNKLKDVFKSSEEKLANTIEAGLDGIFLNSLPAPESMDEDMDDETGCADDCSMHDLSSWRVTIPRIGARPDPDNPRKQYFVFIIDVRRVDVREDDTEKWQWTVARRYPEFYALEQKLTEFHVNFQTSTEAAKPRPSKLPRKGSEASLMSTSSEKLAGTHFENNMNLPFDPLPCKNESAVDLLELDGVFDAFVYLAKQIYKAPSWLYQLVLSARILVKDTVEVYVEHYLDFKIGQVTQEHRLVRLVHLLRDVLFFDDEPPRTDEDKKQRYQQTLEELIDFIPAPVAAALGQRCTRTGSEFLLNIFQQPKLNKQLTYVLLDILLLELFPELTTSSLSS